VDRQPSDPFTDEARTINPVEVVFLPSTRELVVTHRAQVETAVGGHIGVFQLDASGSATFDRTVPAARESTGIAIDPVTGRVFVAFVGEDRVAGLRLDAPSQAAPPPATAAEALPGPLEVSLEVEDVARTVGLSLLVLLLVGAPTPLFNETLESNLDAIQGGFRRLLPGGARGSRMTRVARGLRRFSTSLPGLGAYLLVAAIIYSFLTPGFPGDDGIVVFGVAVLGLAVANAVDIVPGQRYVAGRYGDHGRVRVALWTLVLAAGCVLISRIAGMQPGYMYGIIGTFTFTVALGVADEGRMEARGALALLILAIVVWFARIPFEPTPGVPAAGLELAINSGLVGIFVVAVEGLVFGLVPLRFLPGQKIMAWSRWRWLVLWGAGLALFAHVLVYPVTVAQPNPDPASLTTTLGSVALYGALATGFWGYFRWRARARPAVGADTEAGSPA
jgi:hypothetical protein